MIPFIKSELRLPRTIWLLTALALLTLSAYSPVLSSPFKTLDDDFSIVRNADIQDVALWPRLFTQSFFKGHDYYRPLVSLSFALEYHAFGLRPFFYYLDNILLHLLNAVLVFLIAGAFTASRGTRYAAALLFALHPVQWEAVANIPGRSILLAAFFSLGAFQLFIQAQRGARWAAVVSPGLFFLALLSKESALMLPAVLAVFLVLVQRQSPRARTFWAALVPFALITAGYMVLRAAVKTALPATGLPWEGAALGFLTFLTGCVTYLRLLVFPVGLHFDRSLALLDGFADPRLGIPAAAGAALSVLVVTQRRKISAKTAFLVLWAALELLPVSQLLVSVGVQPGRISLAEHFLYLPCAAFALFAALGLRRLGTAWMEARRLHPAVAVFFGLGLTGFFFLTTLQQNLYAQTEIGMLEQSLHYSPQNIRLRTSLGLAYAKLRQFPEAEAEFRRVLRQDPGQSRARAGLGKALCDQGKFWEGLAQYDLVAPGGEPEQIARANRLATARYLAGEFRRELQSRPDDARLYYSLGVALAKAGDFDGAMTAYRRAVDLNPGFAEALFNLAGGCEVQGDTAQAAVYYQNMLSLPSVEKELVDHARRRLQVLGAAPVIQEDPSL